MKQTFTVGTTTYTACVTHGTREIQAKIASMGKADPSIFERCAWADLWGSVTEDVLMQDRIAEIAELARKCKPRKPTVRADSRVYPRWGATASTADYVREYHLANAPKHCAGDVKAWVKDFYQPLSERVTIPQGEYSEEICLFGL